MEPIDISIRRAGVQDADAIAPLFDAYRQFHSLPPDIELARAFLAERLIRAESAVFFAVHGEPDAAGPIGFVQLYPSFSSVSACRIWVLNDLFVIPSFRGRGVARALMEHARTFAIESGAKRLVLETAPDNRTAQRLYGSLGYVCQNETSRFYSLELG